MPAAAVPPPSPQLTGAAPAPQAAAAATPAPAWWWLIPAALAGAIAAWLLLRRRDSKPAARAESAPAAAPPPSPEQPPLPAGPETLKLTLEPVRLSITLINAALQYRVTLANRTAAPFRQVALALDMIGAHASLSDDSQLARDGAALELRHELFDLSPDEVVELVGEIRLPLTDVRAIRAGSALLFVPLVRLRADFDGQTLTHVTVFGEAPNFPAGPLRPFRLDLGPRLFDDLATREIAI